MNADGERTLNMRERIRRVGLLARFVLFAAILSDHVVYAAGFSVICGIPLYPDALRVTDPRSVTIHRLDALLYGWLRG
jgi:hypothetical protein